jgi:WD40 repeat protein
MVSTASFGGVAVWGTSDGQLKRTLEYKNPLISLSWSPDLRWAAAGTQDQGIHIWRTTHQPDEMQMTGFASKVREMGWHKGSRWFVTGGAPEVAVWDCGGPGPAGREPRQLVWHEGNVSAIACQHRGPLAASGSRDGGLAIWNVETPHMAEGNQVEAPLTTMNLASEIVQTTWSLDDRLLLTGDSDGEVRLFRVGL